MIPDGVAPVKRVRSTGDTGRDNYIERRSLEMSEPNSADHSGHSGYATLIGERNTGYYLGHFERFDQGGKITLTWNWPAFIFSFFWLVYRGMYGYAWLYFILAILLYYISSYLYVIVAFIAFPLFANAIYFRFLKNRFEKIRQGAQPGSMVADTTSTLGRVSTARRALHLTIGLLVFLLILAIILPGYTPYMIWSYKKNLNEGYAVGHKAALAVTDYYNKNRVMPRSLKEAGVTSQPAISSVKEIFFDRETGVIHVVMKSIPQTLEGNALLFTPVISKDTVLWKCSSKGISLEYLPESCKKDAVFNP